MENFSCQMDTDRTIRQSPHWKIPQIRYTQGHAFIRFSWLKTDIDNRHYLQPDKNHNVWGIYSGPCNSKEIKHLKKLATLQ